MSSEENALGLNVSIEELGPCKKLIRFEVKAESVDAAFAKTTRDFVKHAKLPGFRPGKAPEPMILKHFEKEIGEEVKKRLMREAFEQGTKEKKLNIISQPDVEEIHFARGNALQFAATVETGPEFDLPDYRGLPARREQATVSDDEVVKALGSLRDHAATFRTLERPVQDGDFVVVNYQGSSEGKPLSELAPAARGLTERSNFWVEVKPDSFIPGFAQQLVGAKAREKRTVTVDLPTNFVTPELAGRKATYEVEVLEVKEKVLPDLNDAFASGYGAADLEKLREGVRRDLQNEVNARQKRSIRNQLVKALSERLQFGLPESALQVETRKVVYEMVNEYQQRGMSKEEIEKHKDEIYDAGKSIAGERVKLTFIFNKIAEKEGIRIERDELSARLALLAQTNNMPTKKYVEELEKRDGLADIYSQLLHEKVLSFLHENAKIEEAPAPAPEPAAAAAAEASTPEPAPPQPS